MHKFWPQQIKQKTEAKIQGSDIALPFIYLGFCCMPVSSMISSGIGNAYLGSFGGKVKVSPFIFLRNVTFAPSKFKRFKSIQRNPRITSSFRRSAKT